MIDLLINVYFYCINVLYDFKQSHCFVTSKSSYIAFTRRVCIYPKHVDVVIPNFLDTFVLSFCFVLTHCTLTNILSIYNKIRLKVVGKIVAITYILGWLQRLFVFSSHSVHKFIMVSELRLYKIEIIFQLLIHLCYLIKYW